MLSSFVIMVEILEKNSDFLCDKEIKFAQAGLINTTCNIKQFIIDKTIHYILFSLNQNYSKEQLKFVICNKGKGYRSKRDFIMKKLNDFPDGTYDLNTGDPIDFSGQKKFQVAFQTTASEDKTSEKYMTNDLYDALVEVYSWLTGSKPYLGKFEVAEISFLCDSFELAMKIAKMHNQKSIWSWEIMDEIQNPDYDPTQNLVKAGKKN